MQEWNQKWEELNERQDLRQVKNLLVDMVNLRVTLHDKIVSAQVGQNSKMLAEYWRVS